MQKKIASILFSTRLTALLFLVFAAAMAVGTFMDQGYEKPPTPYAREMIFNAWWFEAILVFLSSILWEICSVTDCCEKKSGPLC